MSFADYIRLALKNLTRQKSRTFLTIVAITVGSLSLILMASLIISIRQSLTEQFDKLGAFNLVTVIKDPNSTNTNSLLGSGGGDPSEGKLINDATVTALKKLDHVMMATATLSTNIGSVRLDGQKIKTWANLMGYDPNANVFDLPIAAGRNIQSSDMDKVVVGGRIIQTYGYSTHPQDLLGKNLLLQIKSGGCNAPDWGNPPEKPPTTGDSKDFCNKMQTVEIPAEIVGVADNSSIDDGQSYINIAWARRLNSNVHWEFDQSAQQKANAASQALTDQQKQTEKQTGVSQSNNDNQNNNSSGYMVLKKDDNFAQTGYSSVILKIDDKSNIQTVATEVKKLGYGAMTAQAMLDQINRILYLIGALLAVIGGISLFVASIGIINTMIMATYERIREIGVMRACGATRATIRHLFTFEAAMLGFWGGVFGVLISLILGMTARLLIQHFGGGVGSNIPIDKIGSFPWWLVVSVIAFTTLLGMISGLYPAIKAARLNPVEALRYE